MWPYSFFFVHTSRGFNFDFKQPNWNKMKYKLFFLHVFSWTGNCYYAFQLEIYLSGRKEGVKRASNAIGQPSLLSLLPDEKRKKEKKSKKERKKREKAQRPRNELLVLKVMLELVSNTEIRLTTPETYLKNYFNFFFLDFYKMSLLKQESERLSWESHFITMGLQR